MHTASVLPRRLALLLVLVVAALVAAGCADAGDEPDPAVLPDPGGATGTADPAAAASSTTSTTSTSTTLRPPTPTDPPEIPPAMFGDLEVPCGSGGITGSVPVGPGVDDTAITIGTGNDRGGIATSGAGRGVVEATAALVDLCNRLGGLADHDLRLVEYDAAGVEAGDRVTTACTETLALVGYAYVQALEALQAAATCGLPAFPAGVGLVSRTPFLFHGHLAAALAGGSGVVALVGPDTPLSQAELDRHRRAIVAFGDPLAVGATLAYPVDVTPDWDRIVGEARSSGAGQVFVAGGCAHAVVPFLEVADRAGWSPVVVVGPDGYDEECLVAPGADRIVVEIPFLPFEDGAAAPVTAELATELDLLAAPRTGNAVLAASAFWRWTEAAAGCGADLTHACLSAAGAPTGWTAGGLHPAVEPDGTSPPCAVVMVGGVDGFSRVVPAEAGQYECREDWSVASP